MCNRYWLEVARTIHYRVFRNNSVHLIENIRDKKREHVSSLCHKKGGQFERGQSRLFSLHRLSPERERISRLGTSRADTFKTIVSSFPLSPGWLIRVTLAKQRHDWFKSFDDYWGASCKAMTRDVTEDPWGMGLGRVRFRLVSVGPKWASRLELYKSKVEAWGSTWILDVASICWTSCMIAVAMKEKGFVPDWRPSAVIWPSARKQGSTIRHWTSR